MKSPSPHKEIEQWEESFDRNFWLHRIPKNTKQMGDIKLFIKSLLSTHTASVWAESYEKGYQDALDKKYGIAMERIIKATKSLTIREMKSRLRALVDKM